MNSFSVIIATYNAEAFIEQSIESVLNQNLNVQIIIVDGLSTDRTMDRVRKYESKGVVVLSEKDFGVYDAWNKGIELASGDWLIFLGADDYFSSTTCIEELDKFLTNENTANIVYGTINVIDQDGVTIRVENMPWSLCRQRFNKNMPFTHVGSAHKKSLFQKRRFDASLKIAGDYDFLFPIFLSDAVAFAPEYVINMRSGGLSTNLKNRCVLLNEILLIRKKYSIKVGILQATWTWGKLVYFQIRLGLGI